MSHPNIRLVDRAKETTTTTGSGTVSLGGAVAGFVAISGVGNGNSTYYTLEEGNNFEVGIGTYTSAGNTLSRDEVFSSSNSDDSKIDLAGSTTVFITYPADKAVIETSGNYVGIGGIDPEYQLVVSGTGSFNTVRWADGTTQTTAATDTTYTAGTGLSLVGTEFNITGIDSTMIVDGSVSNSDLANSSLTVTAGTGLSNGGAVALGASITIDADTATTSQVGVVQLQDSATDGTTDKAITPNAVYDISGVLASDIASTGSSNLSLIRSYIDTSDNATFNNVTAQGNLTVSGTLTYLDSTTVTIADKQLELASNSGTPIGGDSAVNDGGIVVKSTDSDKKWTWLDATDAWTSTEHISLNSSKNIIFGDGTEQSTSPTGDISTVSGLTVTNASNIASTGATNAANIATNTSNISTNTTNIASTGATNAADIDTVSGLLYDYWTLRGDTATTTNVDTTETVQFTGAGNTSVTLGGTDNRVVTISGSGGGDTTYTAGTGLSLVDTEFNVSGIDSTMIVDGSVTNSDLQNSSITITAGTGLSNGGAVSLGASVTVDADTASTSQVGVVQLQDSATDGTVDKAITPNAVYDIQTTLQTNINTNTTNIASTGATNAAAIATNVTNIATNATNISTNTTNIAATGATNAAAAATNATNISTNATNISTNATNIASTGATNAANIATVSGLLPSPGGSDTQIQFNDGDSFGGDSDLIWNKTHNLLTVNGTGVFDRIGVNDSTPDAMVGVVCASDDIGLKIQMNASQSVNPFEIVHSDGTHRASIDTAGDLSCGAISGSGSTFTYGRIDISPTFRAATGANNLNIRNPNTDKDINFDVHTTAGAINFRDYPNYIDYFHFKMGSDADGTGMYIRSRDDTSILTQWQSAGGTPVAMVNPTGAISGQHFIFGDGTTQSTASAGGAGAPTDAQYITLALDGDLSAERVLTSSTGIHIVDGGANGNVTVSVSGSTTSQLGIVQLQDSATDGTVDKAITPNAVYDIQTTLQTNINTNTTNIAATGATNAAAIAAKDNYQYWTITDGSNTSNLQTTEDVKITGAGQVTVTLASGNPNVVTVSGAAGGGGGGGSPGGSDTQVQFNDSTSFGGDADLTWNKTTNVLTVAGHIAATTKSFLIDHPVKENKKLQYASLEGPENGVYVRGHTTSHVIELPDYWVALVDPESITVHLTPKGQPQPSLCVNRVSENKVYLSSDQYISAYYTVSATRKDVPPLEVEI